MNWHIHITQKISHKWRESWGGESKLIKPPSDDQRLKVPLHHMCHNEAVRAKQLAPSQNIQRTTSIRHLNSLSILWFYVFFRKLNDNRQFRACLEEGARMANPAQNQLSWTVKCRRFSCAIWAHYKCHISRRSLGNTSHWPCYNWTLLQTASSMLHC